VTKVYSAKINANGALDSWSEQADLPLELTFHQLVEVTGTLYVLGGDSAATDPLTATQSASVQDSVFFNPIDLKTGARAAS
jgi:N-acetylneuraminic acid mutarotase